MGGDSYLLELDTLGSGLSSGLFVGLSLLEKSLGNKDLLSGGDGTVVGRGGHAR